MDSCIFCDIIAKKIPADIVYEDDAVLAFLDIHPTNPGHLLVVPKVHYESMMTTPPAVVASIATVLPLLTRAVVRASKSEGCNVNSNNGAAAGQVVSHLHIHIIPRFAADGYKPWGHKEYQSGEAAAMATAIREAVEI